MNDLPLFVASTLSDNRPMSFRFDMRLLISGMARSGTKYLATVLSAAGLPCSHESAFKTYNRVDPTASSVESSCFSAPWLGMASPSTPIVHLVRNPLSWLTSWQSKSIAREYLSQYLCFDYGWRYMEDPSAAALQAWTEWNLRIEAYAWRRFRLESLTALDIRTIAELAGCHISPEDAHRALAETPRNINSMGFREAVIPNPSRELDRARRLAVRYGYSSEDLNGRA